MSVNCKMIFNQSKLVYSINFLYAGVSIHEENDNLLLNDNGISALILNLKRIINQFFFLFFVVVLRRGSLYVFNFFGKLARERVISIIIIIILCIHFGLCIRSF
jgi:hypothetical protein